MRGRGSKEDGLDCKGECFEELDLDQKEKKKKTRKAIAKVTQRFHSEKV